MKADTIEFTYEKFQSAFSDVDHNTESRRSTVSIFDGVKPVVQKSSSSEEEIGEVASTLKKLADDGVRPEEIGLFVRSEAELQRGIAAIKDASLEPHQLSDRMSTQYGRVSIGMMHLAKGLEFKAVIVMACDDEVIPNQMRLEGAADEADLEEIYQTERHLLYVACTRARDFLMISGVEPTSEFLEDLGG